MKYHYDLAAASKNPYAKRLKRSVTIRLDESTVEYFKDLAAETELPYQSLINLYLRDCAASGRKLAMTWRRDRRKPPDPSRASLTESSSVRHARLICA